MIRVVELFSGIGAQRMALTLAGIPHKVVNISEIDKHALASYQAIYGDCPNMGDITKVEALPSCDLVTYSFPCQDLSLAGKRKGMGEGTRSGLVWEVVRLLGSADPRPEWLLMENVPQVLTAPEWPTLVARLEAMGYRNKWAKLDSCCFGSAQKRIRAFMLSRLGAEPPDLPLEGPCAPSLCLRDVMEPSRDEKYVRRIPLDRIKWREPQSDAKKSDDRPLEVVGEDMSEGQWKPHRYIMAPESPCRNVGAYVNAAQRGIKVVADVDNPDELERWNRLYSEGGVSPTIPWRLNTHGTSIKVVADGKEVVPDDGICPMGCFTKDGGLDMTMRHRTVASRKRRLYGDVGLAPTVLKSDSPTKVADGIDYGDRTELVPLMEEGDVCPMLTPGRKVKRQNGQRYREPNSPAYTVTCQDHNGAAYIQGGDLVVSILTPRECWRLMGFPEWAYLRAARVSSETQLYNQAGNSIVVEVLMAIFRTMVSPPRTAVQTTLEVGA